MSRELVDQQRNQIEVYYDGQCPLCRWSRARVELRDTKRRTVWFDLHNPEAQRRAAPHTMDELTRDVHVRDANGVWARGYAAWVEVARVLPGWRWLAGVMSVFPFTWLGRKVYRRIADNRYRIFGIPAACNDKEKCRSSAVIEEASR